MKHMQQVISKTKTYYARVASSYGAAKKRVSVTRPRKTSSPAEIKDGSRFSPDFVNPLKHHGKPQ